MGCHHNLMVALIFKLCQNVIDLKHWRISSKSFILKVEVGWSKAGGCGSDGAGFFSQLFFHFKHWVSFLTEPLLITLTLFESEYIKSLSFQQERKPSMMAEIKNSSDSRVFTGKYLTYFDNFNNNRKPLFGSSLTLPLPTKCCYSISLMKRKKYWSLSLTSPRNHPYGEERAGERRACWDQRSQTRERGTHGSHKAALIQKLNQLQSGLTDCSSKPQNTQPRSQKSHFIVSTECWVWSHSIWVYRVNTCVLFCTHIPGLTCDVTAPTRQRRTSRRKWTSHRCFIPNTCTDTGFRSKREDGKSRTHDVSLTTRLKEKKVSSVCNVSGQHAHNLILYLLLCIHGNQTFV